MVRRFLRYLVACLILAGLPAGCGRSPQPAKRQPTTSPAASHPAAGRGGGRPVASRPDDALDPPEASPAASVDSAPSPAVAAPPRHEVDDARAAAEGIRRLAGRRLTLYTDLPSTEQLDRLPDAFEQAFPEWCDYFGIAAAEHPDWAATGCLMRDQARFERAGLMPASLPRFLHGFNLGDRLWVYDQPSDFYRRHLLLHEGTHAFMEAMLGGCGPPWYMEGMAEMLGTHRWQDGRLTLGWFPTSREEAPYWGRVRIIRDAVAAGGPMSLDDVIDLPGPAFLEVEAYAWSWAAVTLLDRHPRYRDRFRRMHNDVLRGDFNDRFRRLIGSDWEPLAEEWLLFVSGMEYGYDVARAAVDFTPGRPLPSDGAQVSVAADRGWQNSGLRLERGVAYRLVASGRYQVAAEPPVWWSEPGGVSIRYYQGRPLGVLLAAVRSDQGDDPAASGLLRPTVVGLGATLTPEHSGTLYLKINDSAAELADNAGQLTVEVRPQ